MTTIYDFELMTVYDFYLDIRRDPNEHERLPKNKEFGRLVRAWRKHHKLTQKQTADMANTSQAHLSRVERGEDRPLRATVARLLALQPWAGPAGAAPNTVAASTALVLLNPDRYRFEMDVERPHRQMRVRCVMHTFTEGLCVPLPE